MSSHRTAAVKSRTDSVIASSVRKKVNQNWVSHHHVRGFVFFLHLSRNETRSVDSSNFLSKYFHIEIENAAPEAFASKNFCGSISRTISVIEHENVGALCWRLGLLRVRPTLTTINVSRKREKNCHKELKRQSLGCKYLRLLSATI